MSSCIRAINVTQQCTGIVFRGFIKFLPRRSVGFFSRAFLVFLSKESKKRRRKQPGKLMVKSRSQPVNLPGGRPLMNPLCIKQLLMNIRLFCFRNPRDIQMSSRSALSSVVLIFSTIIQFLTFFWYISYLIPSGNFRSL